jgi:hypothetical protein
MIKKQIYMDKEELRTMDILTSNDYIGDITNTEWIGYLDRYKVTIEFDSKEELKLFCNMYGYKTSRLNNSLLQKTEL